MLASRTACAPKFGIDLNKEWLVTWHFIEVGSPIHGISRYLTYYSTCKLGISWIKFLLCIIFLRPFVVVTAPPCDVATLWERQHIGSTILPNPSIQDWYVQGYAIIDKATVVPPGADGPPGGIAWGQPSWFYSWLQHGYAKPCSTRHVASWLLFTSHDSQYPSCLSMMNPLEHIWTSIYHDYSNDYLQPSSIIHDMSTIISSHTRPLVKHHWQPCETSPWL